MQERKYAGQEGCRTGRMQDRRGTGQGGFRTGVMQESRDSGKVLIGCSDSVSLNYYIGHPQCKQLLEVQSDWEKA